MQVLEFLLKIILLVAGMITLITAVPISLAISGLVWTFKKLTGTISSIKF